MNAPGFVTRNFRLKAVAAVFATLTWAGVVYASNPPDTRSVTVAVPQDSAAVSPYVLVHPIPDLVLRVSGTREHLTAFQPADLVVSINFRAITHTGLQQIPITVINNDHDVVMDTPPAAVTAELDHLGSATVTVTVVISSPPPQGYVVTSDSVVPSTVSVIGPQQQLAGVQARVTVDLANQKTNFQADEPVSLYDASGQKLGSFGITIAGIPGHPQGTVQVSITVDASLTSRASAVLPRVSGTVGPGHEVSAITQSPLTVVLNGPQDLLNTLDSVPTEAISLNGVTSTVSLAVHIVPPAGVTASPSTVIVTITVVAIPTLSPSLSPSPSPTPAPTPTPTPTPTPSPRST